MYNFIMSSCLQELPLPECWHLQSFIIVGGTFALYSLLCRNLNIGILPSKCMDSNSKVSHSSGHEGAKDHSRLGKFFEKSIIARRVLLFIAMLGTCMLIGDGILTPAISGLWPCPQNWRSMMQNLCVVFALISLNLFSLVSNGWDTCTFPFCQ